MTGSTDQLRARRGPIFERWYEAMHVRFEHRRVVMDDLQNDE
jgi:hypothetical protein